MIKILNIIRLLILQFIIYGLIYYMTFIINIMISNSIKVNIVVTKNKKNSYLTDFIFFY